MKGTPQNGYGQPSAAPKVVCFCSGDWCNFAPALTAAEFGKDNIRVSTIAPGIVRTPIHARNGIENVDDLAGLALLGRVGESAEAADAIFHLATAKFTTGVIYPLDGGHIAGHHFG